MKIIVTLCILALLLINPVQETQTPATFDEDFFKTELQNAVLEFCEDAGIDPDSVYMPFRDELK